MVVEKKKIDERFMTLGMIAPPTPRIEEVKTDSSLSD